MTEIISVFQMVWDIAFFPLYHLSLENAAAAVPLLCGVLTLIFGYFIKFFRVF